MKLVLSNAKEIQTQIVDIALTTGGELRAQISVNPANVDFVELVKDLNNGLFEEFTVVRGENESEIFTGFNTVAKATRRMNEYNDDIFIELIHKDFAHVVQTDGDSLDSI